MSSPFFSGFAAVCEVPGTGGSKALSGFPVPSSPPLVWGLPCFFFLGRNPKISPPSWSRSPYWAGGGCCGFCQLKVLAGYWFCWARRGLFHITPALHLDALPAQRGPEELILTYLFLSFINPAPGLRTHPFPDLTSPCCHIPCLRCDVPLLCWVRGLWPPS